MFSLYIIISHDKLLQKSHSINEAEIFGSLLPIISQKGGVVSAFSKYFSYFPSTYEYSRETFILCLQELYLQLKNMSDLVGFSIIIDNIEPTSEFEYSEMRNQLLIQTTTVDTIWFTESSYESVSYLFSGTRSKSLVRVPKSFFSLTFNIDHIDMGFIDSSMQYILDNLDGSVTYFREEIGIISYQNISYWADNSGIGKVFYLDFGLSCDKILTFIDYLLTLQYLFDPNKELNDEELLNWGNYLDLYNKFSSRSNDSFILDDSSIHLNKLILLWIESFSLRHKTLFIIKYDSDSHLNDLWSILSLLNNVQFFIFNNEHIDSSIRLPRLPTLKKSIGQSIDSFLMNKSDESLMVLYLTLITGGAILSSDILYILKNLNFNMLKFKEELDNYRRIGFLIGDQFLYPGSSEILKTIIKIRPALVYGWKNNFLNSFLDLKYDNFFSYSYIFSYIGLDSDFNDKALEVLYHFMQKILDLGRETTLDLDFIDKSFENPSLKNILRYKKIRENRLRHSISAMEIKSVSSLPALYNTPLEFMELLNIWSNNSDSDLINRCKALYFIYQSKGEKFNESRIKILFSLGLLSIGSVSESVDYFELNCSFSKSISDTYSYIRNGCFLSASLFIKGDISGVLRVSEMFLKNDWIYFKNRWLLYLKFIRVRALLEIGSYAEALELLDSGLVLAKNFSYVDVLTVYTNWKGRILYYLGREGEAREILLSGKLNNEGYFFLSEIEYYSGNIERALTYIDKVDLTNDDLILFDENLKWRDGFFVIEEFFDRVNRISVLFQEIINFRYLLNIINGDSISLDKFHKIISGISNNSIAVHDYRYIFYLYKATKGMEEEDLVFNRENLMNRVIRLLQQRTSNMAEHNQKHLYLRNFYNGPIIEISRSKKLF